MIKYFLDKFFNSFIWYNIYYKHTKKHKEDLNRTKAEVIKKRLEIIGK